MEGLTLEVIFIAPEEISSTNPTVSIIKKNTKLLKPYKPIWYNVTDAGNNKIISKSNTRNSKATRKKWIWNWSLVCPKILIKPH